MYNNVIYSGATHQTKSAQHLQRTPPPKSCSVSFVDKKIGHIIKEIKSINSLISFAENPNLHSSAVALNAENWAAWFSKVAGHMPIKQANYQRISDLATKMIKDIPFCGPGQCAQISKAAGVLCLNQGNLSQWIFENALSRISEFNAQEFYMLIDGAQKIVEPSSLKKILSSYSHRLNQEAGWTKFLRELKPQGVSSILKACASIEWRGSLSYNLFERALMQEDFKTQEKIDLIGGLSLYVNKDKRALALLNQIESELALIDLPLDSYLIAMSRFASCNYIPFKLLPRAESILNEPSAHIWDKISLFHTLAILGMVKYAKKFEHFMQTIANAKTTDGMQAFARIYFEDLVRFMHCAAVFLPSREPTPAIIVEIAAHLESNLSLLSLKDCTRLIAPLRAFGWFDTAEKVEQISSVNSNVTISSAQRYVTEFIKNFLQNHQTLNRLKMVSEGDVKGMKVDILIDGFKELGAQQLPIAIELDGVVHWACNQSNHLLGKDVIRSKSLEQASCEVLVYDLRKGPELVAQQIIAYLENKSLQWFAN